MLAATSARAADTPLRFGILPLGGPLESRNAWQPLLNAMSQAVGQPVHTRSVVSYEALQAAIGRHEVDIAFLSGKLALHAVTRDDMTVVAQVTRADGLPGYRAVLLTRKDGPVTRDNLLTSPGAWTLARGEALSMSGYVVPNLQFFLPHGIRPAQYFRQEIVGTHQDNALAVANGEVHVATNNSADLERFRERFPLEFTRLEVLWSSELIPHAQVVVSRRIPRATRERLSQFLLAYGRGEHADAQAERAILERLHGFTAFLPADNRSLEMTVRLNYQLARESALAAQWVNEDALQERLRRLSQEQDRQLSALQADDTR